MTVKIPARHAVYEGQVPFHDCDPLAIVWHGHYYKYLEIARTLLLERHRLDMSDFIELGHRLVVIESRCRYAYPLRYGDRYRVRAWVVDAEMRLHIAYDVQNVTHERRSAKAWTTLVTTDPEGNMSLELPAEVARRVREEWRDA